MNTRAMEMADAATSTAMSTARAAEGGAGGAEGTMREVATAELETIRRSDGGAAATSTGCRLSARSSGGAAGSSAIWSAP
jgi:hypothetical protein